MRMGRERGTMSWGGGDEDRRRSSVSGRFPARDQQMAKSGKGVIEVHGFDSQVLRLVQHVGQTPNLRRRANGEAQRCA